MTFVCFLYTKSGLQICRKHYIFFIIFAVIFAFQNLTNNFSGDVRQRKRNLSNFPKNSLQHREFCELDFSTSIPMQATTVTYLSRSLNTVEKAQARCLPFSVCFPITLPGCTFHKTIILNPHVKEKHGGGSIIPIIMLTVTSFVVNSENNMQSYS
jgi:hypothetical protein